MSTDFRFVIPVPFEKISKFKVQGIRVEPAEGYDPSEHVILTDGQNYVHAYTGDGTDTGLTRYGLNDPSFILAALIRRFGPIISEHDETFFSGDLEVDVQQAAQRGCMLFPLPDFPEPEVGAHQPEEAKPPGHARKPKQTPKRKRRK